ncbi:MAG: hypothetical protein PHV06_06660 [bacterium]|nr:hypothetical protein [bacterium]
MKILKSKFLVIPALLIILMLSFHLSFMQNKKIPQAPDFKNENLPLYLLGSVRNIISDFLWIRVDLYHHSWEWGGNYWTENENLIILYRFITYLNPHHEQAYVQGGYHLIANLNKKQEGLEFLEEGLKNNPNSFEIRFELAFEYFLNFNNPDLAIKYSKEALLLTNDPQALLNLYKILAHSYYNKQDYRTALLYWYRIHDLEPATFHISDKWIQELKKLIEN